MSVIPQEVRISRARDTLTLVYAEQSFVLPAEYLRVYSPSAEVRGHGLGQEKLQTGKRYIQITDLSAIGHNALKINFSDGHDSGLYDWDYLLMLCRKQESLWENYLTRLSAAGASREISDDQPGKKHASCGGCHH